ncbi:hypothetical protein D1872_255160 [compost metagenome]
MIPPFLVDSTFMSRIKARMPMASQVCCPSLIGRKYPEYVAKAMHSAATEAG